MPTLEEFASMTTLPVLAVRVRRRSEQYHVVTDGASVGRSESCTIPVDCCDLCGEHLTVFEHQRGKFSIEAIDSRFAMTLESGCDVERVKLESGVEFSVGDAKFRFLYVDVRIAIDRPINFDSPIAAELLPDAVEASAVRLPDLRVACPRCRSEVLALPSAAKFCPRCGLELPANCPPWNADGSISLTTPALIAYANALFNLGIRYENVAGGYDLAQAIRYYSKAAKLGINRAKARLEAR
jgi:hypothetical protein